MRQTLLLATFVLLVFGRFLSAEEKTIILETGSCSNYFFTFDTSKISGEQLRRYLKLYPPTSFPNIPVLELCVAADPSYQECGTRDIRAANYLKNAETNIKKSEKELRELVDLYKQSPKELRPLLAYHKRRFNFWISLEKRRLDFYKSWHIGLLRRKLQGLEPEKICPEIIEKIKLAASNEERYELARYGWDNAINQEFHRRWPEEMVPEEQCWKDFLNRFGIRKEEVESSISCE